MQLVNLKDNQRRICSAWIDVPQPMYVYHSEEELELNEKSESKPPLMKISGIDDYQFLLKDLGYTEEKGYKEFMHLNVWIRTIDEYMPDYTDEAGKVFYKKDSDGNAIPLESGWVRLYKSYKFAYKHLLYTSSGIWNVSINEWKISAGIKTQFASVTRASYNRPAQYQKAFEKILNKNRAGSQEIRAVHALLNPLSDTFFNVDRTLRKVYKNRVRKADRQKLITSEMFRNAIMKEISLLFPELTQAIQKEIPADDMAKFLRDVVQKAIKDETSSDAMDRMKEVIDMAYTNKAFESGPNPIKQTLIGSSPQPEQPKRIDGRMVMGDEMSKTNEEDLEKERESQNYPDSYVMDDELPTGLEDLLPEEDNG